ncbi:MAG: VOC family protein [Thermomicrobiales bacterium]
MPARVENVTMDCHDERRMAAFWGEALGYRVTVHAPGDWLALSPDEATHPRLSFEVVPEAKIIKNRVHLDLVPTSGTLDAEIARLETLGARRIRYVENGPDESHWIMVDPEGNEFCCSRPPWETRPPSRDG